MQEILTVNELFSGIGAQRKALDRLGIAHEVVGVCEIDKYAIQSYEAIFGKTYNYGDICTAERLEYADLWTYSFPCQDISVAGNQKGISSETRSGLLYQVQRLLEVAKDEGKLPKYLLLENVKNLVGKKFKSQFDDWLFYLDQLGYDTYWQVLNAKHYGIPQNRERVFAISIRKDLNQSFEFPKPEELKIRLKDILEDEVDEKYYLKQSMVDYFIKNSLNNEEKGNGFRFKPHNPQGADIAFAITTRAGARMDDNFVLNEDLNERPFFQFDKDNIKIYQLGRGKNKGGFKELAPTITSSKYEHNNFIVGMFNPYNNTKIVDVAPTQTTGNRNATSSSSVLIAEHKFEDIRIRKLTPLECWRLMGFDDEDFRKAEASGVSNTQLYKQAGNSICVNVLEKIFENLYK